MENVHDLNKKDATVVHEGNVKTFGSETKASSTRGKGGNGNDNPQALSQGGAFDGRMHLLDLLLEA